MRARDSKGERERMCEREGHADRSTDRCTDRYAGWCTDRYTDSQSNRQAQSVSQIDIHAHNHFTKQLKTL